MSDTTEFLTSPHGTAGEDGAGPASGSAPGRSRRGGGLASMLLPELQQMAQSMGIKGTGRMRKGEIISAIQQRQGGPAAAAPQARPGTRQDNSTQRGAPAGAGAPRHLERNAMESDTSTRAASGQRI